MSTPESGGSILKRAKMAVLAGARRTGAFRLVAGSGWRRRRLLILCYHGVSLDDEHRWNANLYVDHKTFRQRLELIRDRRCNVLPLGEAVRRLYDGTLPDRAVTLTFDDGHYDFLAVARPILDEFDVPATVYLTTYHVDCNIPIFALICSYMLWKSGRQTVDLSDFGGRGETHLTSAGQRQTAVDILVDYAASQDLSALEKNDVAAALASRLGLDFDALCERRFLHLLNPGEVVALARSGVDFQLHSHCHRAPRSEAAYRKQIRDNRVRVEQLTGQHPVHFCYPSGVTSPEFVPWLQAEGTVTAATSYTGLASPDDDPHMLPRVLDHSGLSNTEIDAWLSGFAAFVPERARSARMDHRSAVPRESEAVAP